MRNWGKFCGTELVYAKYCSVLENWFKFRTKFLKWTWKTLLIQILSMGFYAINLCAYDLKKDLNRLGLLYKLLHKVTECDLLSNNVESLL